MTGGEKESDLLFLLLNFIYTFVYNTVLPDFSPSLMAANGNRNQGYLLDMVLQAVASCLMLCTYWDIWAALYSNTSFLPLLVLLNAGELHISSQMLCFFISMLK